MYSEQELKDLLNQYPDYVNKEQLRLISHISKRVARELLIRGLIPCKNSGKKTRNYMIAMKDIITYLREREYYPQKYNIGPIPSSYKPKTQIQEVPVITWSDDFLNKLKAYYNRMFKLYPDVVTVAQASEITGHTHKNINRWCNDKRFTAYKKGSSYMIPRICLIEFMASNEYLTLKYKSKKQKETISEFYCYYSALLKD